MTHEQFTQIYLPLCGKMYALAYTLLRNRNAARDCVQNMSKEEASMVIEKVDKMRENYVDDTTVL